MDISEQVIRRASVLSITKPEKHLNEEEKAKAPKDIFFLTHVYFLLIGMLCVLPTNFFVIANDYWMYKFRDPVMDTVDLNNKTTLQKYFGAGNMVVQTLPAAATMLLSTAFGHKIKVNIRMIGILCFMTGVFVVFTIFIEINTDTWQLGFFIGSLSAICLLTGFQNLLQVTTLYVIPKFPAVYMKTWMLGQGFATMFSATLQIVSLAIGFSTLISALIYFISGSSVVFITLLLYFYIRNTEFYSFYFNEELEDTKQKHSKKEMKAVFRDVWPCLLSVIMLILTVYISHPGITSLVVSENYNKGSQWSDVYFVPTITYFFSEACSQFGKLLSRPLYTKTNGPWLVGLIVLRLVILVPLVMFCNAQPRNHLPVLFPHDWQYILLIFIYFFTSGFLINASMLSVAQLTDKSEVAFVIMMSLLGIFSAVSSPLSLLSVSIL